MSALHFDGTPRNGAAHNEGVAASMAERRKERRCPELVGRRARSRLVVLAIEVSIPSALLPTLELGVKGGSCVDPEQA